MLSNNKLVKGLINEIKNYENSSVAFLSKNSLIITNKSETKSKTEEILFATIFLLIVPFCVIYYEQSIEAILIVMLWIGIFSYSLYKFIIVNNEIEIELKNNHIYVKNLSPFGKLFIKPKNIDIHQIKNANIKRVKHSRYGSYFRLEIIYLDNKNHVLYEFNSEGTAKRLKILLENNMQKTAHNNGYHALGHSNK